MFPSVKLISSSPQLANTLLNSITLPKQGDYRCLVLPLVSHVKVSCTQSVCQKHTQSQKSTSVLICSVDELQINSYFRFSLNTVSVWRSELNSYSNIHLKNNVRAEGEFDHTPLKAKFSKQDVELCYHLLILSILSSSFHPVW